MNKYTKVNVVGDGSCYFHAVTGYIELDKNAKKLKGDKKYTYFRKGNASRLRKQVVAWLRNNLDYKLTNGLTIRDDINDAITVDSKLDSISDYLQHMSKPGAYAGQIEITATANILNRSIRTFTRRGSTLHNVGLGYELKGAKGTIHLYHNIGTTKHAGLHHFEILYPKSNALVVSKEVYDKLKLKRKKTARKPVSKKRLPKKKKTGRRRGRRP